MRFDPSSFASSSALGPAGVQAARVDALFWQYVDVDPGQRPRAH